MPSDVPAALKRLIVQWDERAAKPKPRNNVLRAIAAADPARLRTRTVETERRKLAASRARRKAAERREARRDGDA